MTRLSAVCATVGAALAAVPAAAQGGFAALDSSIAGRVGVYIPFETQLRDLDTLWFSLGVDVEFQRSLVPGTTTVLSVDWFTRSGGARSNAFPVIVSQRWYQGEWPRQTYFHVGIGGAFVDFGTSDFVLAARAGVGMFLADNTFAEANFTWTDDGVGPAVSGVAGYIGFKF